MIPLLRISTLLWIALHKAVAQPWRWTLPSRREHHRGGPPTAHCADKIWRQRPNACRRQSATNVLIGLLCAPNACTKQCWSSSSCSMRHAQVSQRHSHLSRAYQRRALCAGVDSRGSAIDISKTRRPGGKNNRLEWKVCTEPALLHTLPFPCVSSPMVTKATTAPGRSHTQPRQPALHTCPTTAQRLSFAVAPTRLCAWILQATQLPRRIQLRPAWTELLQQFRAQ